MLAIAQILADAYYEDYWNPTNKLFVCTTDGCIDKSNNPLKNTSIEVNAKLKIARAHKRVDYPIKNNKNNDKTMELTLYNGMYLISIIGAVFSKSSGKFAKTAGDM